MWRCENFSRSDLIYGFSSLRDGNMSYSRSESGVLANRINFLKSLGISRGEVNVMGVAHGKRVVKISKGSYKGESISWRGVENVDGMFTLAKEVYLFATFADCLPIFFYCPDGCCGLVHAGWRGVVKNVVSSFAGAIKKEGFSLKSFCVGVGPHILNCCFKVGAEVAGLFPKRALGPGNFVDLKTVVERQLLDSGFVKDKISLGSECTKERGYYSHRRTHGRGANAAVIGMR